MNRSVTVVSIDTASMAIDDCNLGVWNPWCAMVVMNQ